MQYAASGSFKQRIEPARKMRENGPARSSHEFFYIEIFHEILPEVGTRNSKIIFSFCMSTRQRPRLRADFLKDANAFDLTNQKSPSKCLVIIDFWLLDIYYSTSDLISQPHSHTDVSDGPVQDAFSLNKVSCSNKRQYHIPISVKYHISQEGKL